MKRISGILVLLIYVCVATTLLSDNFVGASNMENIVRWTSLRGILGIGIAFVIITGGIDLSLGSMVGLIGCLLPIFLGMIDKRPAATAAAWTLEMLGVELLVAGLGWTAWRLSAPDRKARGLGGPLLAAASGLGLLGAGLVTSSLNLPTWVGLVCAVAWSLAVAVHLGIVHGLLITRMKLQPFIVTLCAWLIYRGVARGLTGDQTQGFGTTYNDTLRLIAIGKPCSVALVVCLAGLGIAAWSGWRLAARRKGPPEPGATSMLTFLVATGLALAGIAATRFLPSDIDFSLGSWAVQASPEQLPALLISWVSWLVIPFTGWLVIRTLMADPKAAAPPLIAVVVAVALLVGARWLVRQPDDWFWLGKVWGPRYKMAAIFCSLALVMGGLSWLVRVALRVGGPTAQFPVAASTITALMWLISYKMGATSLAETLLGRMLVPAPFFIMLVMALLAGILLNHTIYGRYLLALGRNEQAARFSGIKTDRLVVMAYVLCALATGFGAVLFSLDVNSVQPSGHGSSYELFAIAAAVLGGCSLRGGEGTILGVLIGAAVMQALFNAINILGIPSRHDFTILGLVILIGVITDEIVKRLAARRRAKSVE